MERLVQQSRCRSEVPLGQPLPVETCPGGIGWSDEQPLGDAAEVERLELQAAHQLGLLRCQLGQRAGTRVEVEIHALTVLTTRTGSCCAPTRRRSSAPSTAGDSSASSDQLSGGPRTVSVHDLPETPRPRLTRAGAGAGQLPWNCGVRFSKKAFWPSR
jgi:hypothetical protein